MPIPLFMLSRVDTTKSFQAEELLLASSLSFISIKLCTCLGRLANDFAELSNADVLLSRPILSISPLEKPFDKSLNIKPNLLVVGDSHAFDTALMLHLTKQYKNKFNINDCIKLFKIHKMILSLTLYENYYKFCDNDNYNNIISNFKFGDLIENYTTSSFVHYDNVSSDFFSVQNSTHNASGSFIVIGSQSFQGGTANTFLNGNTSNVPDDAKITNFSGMLANARFFSKNTTYEEYLNRAKNYDSYGVKNPAINHSFVDEATGSFERVVLRTDAKQATQESDISGNIRLFDFSQNNLHLEGSNFPTSQNVMRNVRVDFESLSDNFDLNYSRDKVRVRSFQDASNLEQGYFSTIAPVHEVLPSEESVDDNRLSLDMSVMKGFNANALKMFNDFSSLDDALGNPNIIFGDSYGDLRHLREVYFNNVIEVMDLQKYRDLFKWIDNSFTDVVFSLVPRTTNFLGINFIYESHILERNRFKYLHDEIYMKSNQRDGNRGNIFLSQFVGRGKKY